METIHLKTTDPFSQHLLRSAAQRGIELHWERYEKAQPQDGFMRLGLCCPFGCLHGPCRIDPFGRGPSTGICGMSREQMVAGTVLRLCQQGAMQALATVPHCAESSGPAPSESLEKLLAHALSDREQAKLCCSEIYNSVNLLQCSSQPHEVLLHQALRLSLLSLVLAEQAGAPADSDTLEISLGYGVINEGPVRIGFSGKPSPELMQELDCKVNEESGSSAVLLSLGEWLQLDGRFMPICTTSCEAELLLSSSAIHLLIAGRGTDSGILQLCDRLQIPVVMDGPAANADEIVKLARARAEQSIQPDLFSDVPAGLTARVIMTPSSFSQAVANDGADQIALIGGADSPHLPLGRLAAELVSGLDASGFEIAGWGDTALWIKKHAQEDSVGRQSLTLQNRFGPLLAVKGLAEAGRLDALKGICFTGIKDVRDFSMALGLAYLGCRVGIATPIPIHGSRNVKNTLSRMIEENGGELLHFDHPAAAEDLVDWFSVPK
jgi:hypothetical protein